MQITREVALNEVRLDHETGLHQWDTIPARVWLSEMGKAIVWFIGLVLILLLMVLWAPESRADSIPIGDVTAYLDANTSLPLAVGVDVQLANNLLKAQQRAWGDVWQTGSLLESENGVLRAINLYVFPGGPSIVTNQHDFPWVWIQSRIAIDTGLSVGFDTLAIDFGEVPVNTPEPATWAGIVLGLIGLSLMRWKYDRTRI